MLIESMGKGGFGEVYLSIDVHLGKSWAVKRLLHQDANGLHEATMMKELDYHTLPRVVDLIREEDGVYLVMDYLQGKSIGQMLRAGHYFSQNEVLEIGIRLADTLEYLHGKNPPVLYRDMKPDNIMLTDEGQIKLVDFGIASLMCMETGGVEGPGGTRGYAAPEQFGGTCDLTTDLFGLGMTLKILSRGKGALRPVIRRCTRRRKAQRYQSASQVRQRLEQIYENKRQNQKLTGWILGCLGVLLAAGAVYSLVSESYQQRYYRLMEGAAQLVKDSKELDKAAELYKDASEICPEKEDTYLKLMDVCLLSGQTQTAVDWLNYVWDVYPEETSDHKLIRERLALLYFCGNSLEPDFYKDYDKAAKLFRYLSEENQMWMQARKLAESLGRFGSEIRWEEIKEALNYLEVYGERMVSQHKTEYACELYIICGSIYLTEASYLWDEEHNPYRKGIYCYEKAKEIAETAKLDPGLKQEILERLASACYLTAVLENLLEDGNREEEISTANLEKSISYGNQLLQMTGSSSLIQRILLREASARRLQNNQEAATQCYEAYLLEYPEDVEGLCAYAELLMENQEYERAHIIMGRAAQLPEAENNRNYKILIERLEGLE
ncbi:MAG TPA: serine/threonine protein kinase [Candidatus Pelethocola excrementipullorum]|nr:serine/threonine protein kinase [Candidatus Pelethocola excrementipullorum]